MKQDLGILTLFKVLLA